MATPSKVVNKAKVAHKLTPDRVQMRAKVPNRAAGTPVRTTRLPAMVVTPDTSDISDLGTVMRQKDHGIRGDTRTSRFGRTCHVKYTDFKDTAVSTKNCNKQMVGPYGGAYRGAQCRYAPSSAI